MSWIQRLIKAISIRFDGAVDSSGSICIKNHIVKVINEDELFSIKIIDFNRFTPPKQIDNIFFDELESSLEDTLKDIV